MADIYYVWAHRLYRFMGSLQMSIVDTLTSVPPRTCVQLLHGCSITVTRQQALFNYIFSWDRGGMELGKTVRWPVTSHLQSGSRERWVLILNSPSPVFSLGSQPVDGASHIQSGSSLRG